MLTLLRRPRAISQAVNSGPARAVLFDVLLRNQVNAVLQLLWLPYHNVDVGIKTRETILEAAGRRERRVSPIPWAKERKGVYGLSLLF